MSSSELDKIIKGGKSSPQLAMVVFAMELKTMQKDVSDIKGIMQDDAKKYATREDNDRVEAKVDKLQDDWDKVLKYVFFFVLAAVIGLVIKQGM